MEGAALTLLQRTSTSSPLPLALALAAVGLAPGCFGSDCPSSGPFVRSAHVAPPRACLAAEYVPLEGDNCIAPNFTLRNSCSEDLALDLSQAPFASASGGSTVKASGVTTFKLVYKAGLQSDGVFKIPGKLGAAAVEVVVDLSYLETD